MHFDYNKYIEIFMQQCTCDKQYLDYICSTYRNQAVSMGMHIESMNVRWSFPMRSKDDEEFLSFIDGNGFTISFHKDNIYHIIPIYTQNPLTERYEWE